MKEKIMKSLVVALLFLFTLYLFQYFNESREKQVRMLRSLLKNTKIKIYNLKLFKSYYSSVFILVHSNIIFGAHPAL